MRIIGGSHKGRAITPPRNFRARPTTDFAKESLFNVLLNYIDLEGIEVLDVFAGTGSISYEFASRGAASVTVVEINAVHYGFIKNTARQLGFSDVIHPVKANVFLYLKNVDKSFDVVFSDAPYDLPDSDKVIDLIFDGNLLKPEGVLIFEHSRQQAYRDHTYFLEQRDYGSVRFSFFCKSGLR